jgi:hypothetical protein
MSIEQALADNTAALQALTKVLAGASVKTTIANTNKAEGTKASSKKAEKTVEKPAETAKPAAAAATTGPSLKLVTDTVLDFAAENSAKAKEILKSFGVSRITELKPAQYDAVLAAVTKAKEAIAAELLTGNDDADSLV